MSEHYDQDEPTVVEELDVEVFAKENDEDRRKPRARVYVIRVDRQRVRVNKAVVTGVEILALVDKTPESHKLFQKFRRGEPHPVDPTEEVDLRRPGIERFQTIPLDTTEGLDQLRRDFQLPESDVEFLEALGLQWETVVEDQTRWLFMHEYPVPPAYNYPNATAALEIAASYPDVQVDMVYFFPHLARSDAGQIRQLAERVIEGKRWQRWSRHRTPQNPWRRGFDCIETHLLLVDEWLQREIRRAA